MRTIFRKAMTVLGSAALVGATVGAAAAASYPEPFTSNSAIVVGANAAPSDSIAASSIAADLDAASAGSGVGGDTTVTGGDSFKFEKSSTLFHLGDTITGVVSSSLDEDDMPVLLADGEFVDNDNDEFDFEQSITMPASQLIMFEDNDYKADEPTVGFRYTAGTHVLNYTLTFNEEPQINDLTTSDLTLMGREYYILSNTTTTSGGLTSLTLLDSAADTIVAEGESVTLTSGGTTYTVSIDFVDSTSAKLNINGETTNKLAEAETQKLQDGSYVGIKEVLYSSKDTGISKVEFSIGNGKLVLTGGSDVELNEDNVDDLTAFLVNDSSGATLSSITLRWNAEDELFVTPDSTITMPGFETVSLAFGGLNYPAEEEVMVSHDGDTSVVLENFPLKDSEEDINLLYGNNSHFTGLGKDSDEQLLTDANADGNVSFDSDSHSYFIVSWDDGRDAESYLMRATNFKIEDSTNKTTFQYRKNGAWVDAKTDREAGDTFSLGNAELAVGNINKVGKSVSLWSNSAQTEFNKLFSAEGLTVRLPVDNSTHTLPGYVNITNGNATQATTFVLRTQEEDKDGDKESGDWVNVTLGWNSQSTPETTVSSVAGGEATATEIGDTDVFRDFTYSALATEILHDQGPDQDTVKLIYHGDEVAADVYITSSDAIVSSGSGEAGILTVTDAEVASVAGKNLVVVGGSAINSVAAELLGGAYRTEEFTEMTGVNAGEFLIESFDRGGTTALLVAGYHAADTTKAATYLINNDVDTDTGMKYTGTSATEASLVVA